jgi:signal transduction histidine kinase
VNGRLDLAVIDNGMGINPDYKDKIFELFFVGTERRGSGLGLYQAQLATRKLGGTILLSSFQKPTCFEIHLPLMS